MLNIIWPIFIIISIIYALLSGNIENASNGIFDSMNSAVNLTLTFFGTICLWNGIMEIVKKTSLINILNKALSPFIKFLFPELKNNKQAKEEISMNMVTNFLGLGNASTPIGLQAMNTLQKDNTKKDTLSNSMIMFIIINIAAIQLIPTNVIAIRTSLGSTAPNSVIVPIWISTIFSAIFGIILTKILTHKKF